MTSVSIQSPGIDSLASLLPAFRFDSLIEHDVTGVVYKARHRSLDRDVAIRVVPSHAGVDAGFRAAFRDNARLMARLSHPNLIRVYDCGEINGDLYSVTEFVAGQSLWRCARGMAVDPMQAAGIIAAASRGLAHAHENGMVHGDITPANILLTAKCEPKIGNFGNPGRFHQDSHEMPSPSAYAAPEMAAGTSDFGPPADVYSLGVILRELLTGVPAESGNPGGGTISDPALDAIHRKATHPDPVCRFPDASAFAGELDRWMASATAPAASNKRPVALHHPPAPVRRPALACPRPTHATPRAPLPPTVTRRPHSGRFVATSGIVAAMLLGTGYLALQPKNADSPARPNRPSQALQSASETTAAPGNHRDRGLVRLARSE